MPVTTECIAALEESVCEDDYDTPQQRAMAENLARREADHELISTLAQGHFVGPAQTMFEAELAAYGYPVMMAWTRTGEIIRKVASKGRPLGVSDTGAGWSRDDRCELSSETVARALVFFRRKVLLACIWDHTRGATIKTYFVGACLFQFPNVYQRWDAERRRWHKYSTAALDDPEDPGGLRRRPGSDDPENTAIIRCHLQQIMGDLAAKDPVLHRVAELRLEGYTDVEAAEEVGLTARAIEGRWYRFRTDLRRHDGGRPA